MEKVNIINMNHTGEGIGNINGKIVFVSKAISGDVVSLKNTREYKNFYRADIDEFYNYSSDREEVRCPYYELCGGCQIMGLSYDKQLKYKRDKVKNIFKKYADIDINPKIIGSKQYRYRNKIILQVKDGKLGLFKNKTHEIVEIDECLLVSDKINTVIRIIKNNINLDKVSKIMIREGNSIMVSFEGEVNDREAVKYLSSKVSSIIVNNKCIYGDNYIEEELNNYKFNVSSESFFQVNKEQTIKLYDKVKEFLGSSNKVMDLYCGTGTIGIYVSDIIKEVLGIELNKMAVIDANKNKDINNVKNISFKCGDVSNIIDDNYECDAIIVDPPRSGLDKKTRDIILEIKPKKLVYVSCDPMTLARDIKYLNNIYIIDDMVLLDMFPNTYHVESVVLLSLKMFEK